MNHSVGSIARSAVLLTVARQCPLILERTLEEAMCYLERNGKPRTAMGHQQ